MTGKLPKRIVFASQKMRGVFPNWGNNIVNYAQDEDRDAGANEEAAI